MALQPGPVPTEGAAPRTLASRERLASILAPLSLLAFAAALLGMSWQRWSSPFYDVGRELYTAWSISQGARLYHDIWLPRGPLSSHWNGLVFEIFGPSITTLALTNLLILALGVVLLHRTIEREYDRTTAVTASFFFLAVFAFARYGKQGNYNFVMPYAHEVTHGLLLSLAAMTLLLHALGDARRERSWLLAAGGALGLVLLTKQEIAVAALVATFATIATCSARPPRRRVEQLGAIALGAALPLGICLLLLGGAPFAMMWNPSIGGVVRDNPFYQGNLGLDRPVAGLLRIGRATLALCAELLLIAGIGRWLAGTSRARIAAALALFAALHLGLFVFGPLRPMRTWHAAPAILPVFAGVVALLCLATRLTSPRPGAARDFLCWLAVFASFMLLKLGLDPRIYHYGFAQALPAAMLFVVVCVGILPGRLARFRIDSRFTRSALASLLVCFGLYSVGLQAAAYGGLAESTGEGPDRFYGPPTDAHLGRIIAALERRVKPGDTLAVLPEGVLFNYLLRVPNPTPHISFLPFEFMLTGERRILEDFRARPPDYVLLMPRNVTEYGMREFGQPGYGDGILDWLRESYIWPEGEESRRPALLRLR